MGPAFKRSKKISALSEFPHVALLYYLSRTFSQLIAFLLTQCLCTSGLNVSSLKVISRNLQVNWPSFLQYSDDIVVTSGGNLKRSALTAKHVVVVRKKYALIVTAKRLLF